MIEATIADKKTQEFYEKEVNKFINKTKVPTNPGYQYYVYQWILKHTKPKCRVLDIGCGAGMLSNMLTKDNREVIGIDISKSSITHCQKHIKKAGFIAASVYKIPSEDNYFDVVACNQLIEHLDNVEDAIKEMIRVLKPNGLLLVTTPVGTTLDIPSKEMVGHKTTWDFYMIMMLFEKFGDDFIIYWINKYRCYSELNTGKYMEKNVFAIKYRKQK